MHWYSVRLELRNASGDAWDRLHKAMWAKGFRRVVMWGGKLYHLPTGSYVIGTKETLENVFNTAKATAETIDKTVLVWAVEFVASMPWLVPAKADPDAPEEPAS